MRGRAAIGGIDLVWVSSGSATQMSWGCRNAGERDARGRGVRFVTVSADTQITELAVNDHACLTFGDPEELFDLTAAYVRDGLASGLKVLWLSDCAPDLSLARLARRGVEVSAAVTAGQMAALSCADCLLRGEAFTAGQAAAWLHDQMAASRDGGYPGLRLAVDMSWALRPITGVEQLPDFEGMVAALLADGTVSMLCQYDRERFDPVTLASVAGLHTRSVAAATYYQDAVLRICRQYAPPGIRLAGEMDYHAEEPLSLALAEALRLDGTITINMASLAFIDAACMRMIVTAARSLPVPRSVVLECAPAIASRFILLGAADVDGLIVRAVDER
jgi:anti-anti-sigma regulatory factor